MDWNITLSSHQPCRAKQCPTWKKNMMHPPSKKITCKITIISDCMNHCITIPDSIIFFKGHKSFTKSNESMHFMIADINLPYSCGIPRLNLKAITIAQRQRRAETWTHSRWRVFSLDNMGTRLMGVPHISTWKMCDYKIPSISLISWPFSMKVGPIAS